MKGLESPTGLLTYSNSVHVLLLGRAGEALWPGKDGGKTVLQNATALTPLFAHLLQQTQKLQAAGCPGAAGIFSFPHSQLLAFSPDFLGVPKQREGSGLSTMLLEAPAGQLASSSSVTPTDKLQSTLRDDLVTKAGLSCLLGQDSSKAPGTFLTASCSRQNRLQGEGNPSMVLSSRETNVKVQEHPALMCSPQVVPAHPAGKAEWLQHLQEGVRYLKTAVLSVGHLSFCKAMPI